jgi:plasmid stabilization system protein ParE
MTPIEYRVIITEEAFANLDSVLDYLAPRSPQNAAAVIDRLLASINDLRNFPHRYAVARRGSRQVGEEIRTMAVPPYLVDYLVDVSSKVVHIVAVTHGARNR